MIIHAKDLRKTSAATSIIALTTLVINLTSVFIYAEADPFIPDVHAGLYEPNPDVTLRLRSDYHPERIVGDGYAVDADLFFLWYDSDNIHLTSSSPDEDYITVSGARFAVGNDRWGDDVRAAVEFRSVEFWNAAVYSEIEALTDIRGRWTLGPVNLNVLQQYGRLAMRESVESKIYVEPRLTERFTINAETIKESMIYGSLDASAIVNDYLTDGLDYMDRTTLAVSLRAGARLTDLGLTFGIEGGVSDLAYREASFLDGYRTTSAGVFVNWPAMPGRRVVGLIGNVAITTIDVSGYAGAFGTDIIEETRLTGSAELQCRLGDAIELSLYGQSGVAPSRESNYARTVEYGARVRWLLKQTTRAYFVAEYGVTEYRQSVGQDLRQWHFGADIDWPLRDNCSLIAGWRKVGHRDIDSMRDYDESRTCLGARMSF